MQQHKDVNLCKAVDKGNKAAILKFESIYYFINSCIYSKIGKKFISFFFYIVTFLKLDQEYNGPYEFPQPKFFPNSSP